MRTTIALAALAASTFCLNAESAETYTYNCKGRVVAVRIVNLDDMTGGTIAVDGRVFSDAHLIDGCQYNFRATDEDGSTAELCTGSRGYASLTIAEEGKKPLRVKCSMNNKKR